MNTEKKIVNWREKRTESEDILAILAWFITTKLKQKASLSL